MPGQLRRPLVVLAVVAAAVLAAAAAWNGVGGSSNAAAGGSDHFTVALFGDMPYNAQGKVDYPNLIADVNKSNAVFSIFDGDLKAGGDGPCLDSLYTTSLSNFSLFRKPLIWVPGDNDWTDCWGRYGPGTGGFDPEERLNHERQVFDSTDKSLGRKGLTLTRESSEGGQYAQYSENVRWQWGPVVFLGLNFQGSNDNLPHAGIDGETRSPEEIARQTAEHNAREAANEHWLDEGFAFAQSVGAKGVLVDWQADPDFNNEYKLDPLSYDGLTALVAKLRADTIAFPGQVALVHGDSHYFKLDKPLNAPNGKVLANFTRLETFGATNTQWVKATIDVKDPNLFEFQPQIVPANVG
jgi:hypothetical protein